MASAPSESKRVEKKMDKTIDHLVTSWNMAAEESAETDIAFMNDIFRGNHGLLRCPTSSVKNSYLVKLVDGSLYNELIEQKMLEKKGHRGAGKHVHVKVPSTISRSCRASQLSFQKLVTPGLREAN